MLFLFFCLFVCIIYFFILLSSNGVNIYLNGRKCLALGMKPKFHSLSTLVPSVIGKWQLGWLQSQGGIMQSFSVSILHLFTYLSSHQARSQRPFSNLFTPLTPSRHSSSPYVHQFAKCFLPCIVVFPRSRVKVP